jgi:hypothetical protein
VSVVVIIVGVVVLIAYALSDPAPVRGTAPRTATAAGVLVELSHVPPSTFDTVGVNVAPTPLTLPTIVRNEPSLVADGKPLVLFVGAEYCPFCAAERWPLIVALSRFGHFRSLHNAQSASLSVFPGVQTFSFVSSSYSSTYLAFEGTELYSDSITATGTFARVAEPTAQQAALMARYGVGGASAGSLPLVDIANRMVATTSGFSPSLLVGLSQATVAGSLDQRGQTTTTPPTAGETAGRAIVASANALTAGICLATGQQPTSVCAGSGVRAAAISLGLP